MSETSGLKEIQDKAKEEEEQYEWSKAADYYHKALNKVAEPDSLRKGEISESLAYCMYRAAFQADDNDQFRERIAEAIAEYKKVEEISADSEEARKAPRMFRCRAMIAFMNYWLASEASGKKKLLNEAWNFAKEALEVLKDTGTYLDYGKTYNQLSLAPILEFTLESDFQTRVLIMKEAVEYGEKAVRFLSSAGNVSELAKACAKTVVCLGVFGYYCQDGRDREESYRKGEDYWARAKKLSEEASILESLCPVFGNQPLLGLEGSDEALANCEKGLEIAKKTKDHFFIGCAFDWLLYQTVWKTFGMEDKDKIAQLAKTVIQYTQEAREQFSKISFTSPRADVAWLGASPADDDMWLAGLETDIERKRELLEEAAEAAPEMLKKAENSGYPEAIAYAHAILAGISSRLAKIETNRVEKKKLLEQALQHTQEDLAATEQLTPLLFWNRGTKQASLAAVKSYLAEMADDNETKKSLLQEAAKNRERSLKLLTEELSFMASKKPSLTSLFASLGDHQSDYGDVLNRLYDLTQNQEYLKKAIEAFKQATESNQKLSLRSRIAECSWKIAKAYDALDEHSNAAQYFSSASNAYEDAAESIPQLKDFYHDHACYMQAWSEIEKARHHHERQEYCLAEEYFERAANMHESLKQWRYLAPNYAALAQVELAEGLSRKDESEEALRTFEKATKLFEETKKSIQEGLSKIEDPNEKHMATQIANATDPRREYCGARIAIEEAKILDKKGDHRASSEKYCSAAESLQEIARTVQSEQEKKEFSLITILSEAWARMTRAEAEGSPDLYLEASQLFEKAKELSPDEMAKGLALGHSRFCRALEAGTKFADTGNAELYKVAIQHLESAAKHYVKAGSQKASEYAKATELLLDAYMHMNNAKAESDPEKKARLYMMAEKILQTSAGSFMKAEHPEKREQVLRLLERVKEERELALSLSEVLHAPSIVSATSAFTMPTPNQENAVGLEKFESANVQANVILRQKELTIGENLDLEIELVNAGKTSAQLVKITEIIPKGFELTEKPEAYRLEDSYLNLKGKRLDPLKTEEVRLVLKPTQQGTFSLKPTVLYLDENGKYKSHQPEPVTITVKELGIKGWLKGER